MTAKTGTRDIVVFDVGGVLLDWDPRHLYRKLIADPAEMEWFLAEVCHGRWNLAQDAGRPWHDAEAEAIARHPDRAAHIRAFRARWGEMVPGSIGGTVALLEEMAAAGVPLYAITNFAADTFREVCARFPFFGHFRGIVVSGEIGIVKPDAGIFHRLAGDHGVDLARAVFIDDNARNCAAAEALGMAAIAFTSPEATRAALYGHGIPVRTAA
jgi:2-haloacid dehalogenase